MSEDISQVMKETRERMEKTAGDLDNALRQIRSGRASTGIVDDIRVEVYGQLMPLNQVANISIPEARMILIDVWDKSNLQAVEKAILKSGKNLTPQNDGTNIRIGLPDMNEETRKEMVKVVKHKVEDHKVAIRNIRRDSNEKIKKLKGDGVSEDDIKGFQSDIQKLTDDYIAQIDKDGEAKEKDIMTV